MTAVATASSVRPTFPRSGDVLLHDTSVNVWEETVDDAGMYAALRSVIARLRFRGFTVHPDRDCADRFKAIAHLNWDGRKGDLEVHLRVAGRHLEILFFQNVANVENRNGGRYDFRRFLRMPRTMQLQCAVEIAACIEKLRDLGYVLHPRTGFREPLLLGVMRIAQGRVDEGDALAAFNRSWDSEYEWKHDVHRFDRDASGWPSDKEAGSWESTDRDGMRVRSGDTVYTRVRGRLVRGVCRYAINGNWLLVDTAGAKVACGHARSFFRCDHPDLEPRRLVPRQTERVRAELDKAVAAKDWSRVATLAGVLERLSAATE